MLCIFGSGKERELPSVASIFQARHVAWSSPELGRRREEAGGSKESQEGKGKMARWC